MKSTQFTESTTSGSVATVSATLGKPHSRNSDVGKGVYPNEKGGSLLTGKKTNKKFANSPVKESADKRVSEAKLDEEDIIIVPGQGLRSKQGFIPRDKDRTDHEVEMAKSDLFQSFKNAKKVYELIANVTEEEGLDGWVQEKIIKANDYLNTVREYLEHKQVGEVNEAAGKFAFKHPISGEIKKFSDRTKGQEWMKTAPSPKKTSARRLKADEIINYVISNSGDAIGEDPNTAPIVGDIITDTSYEFWDEYQKIEPLINQIMKKEYGSNSIDDFLQQSHADYWRDKTSEVNEAGERSALRYEMMLSNGSVKRFSAKDDADAKRIAKSAGAKSLIKLKADGISFKNKIAEQGVEEDKKKPSNAHKNGCGYNYGHDCDCSGSLKHAADCYYNYGHDCDCGLDSSKQNKQQDVAEGEKKQVQDRKTGKMYDPDEEFKKLQNDPEYIAQMKRMGREEGKGWPKRKDEGVVAEDSDDKKQSVDKIIKDTIFTDQISKDREGNYIFRKGYFYRPSGMDPDSWAQQISKKLQGVGINNSVVDSGDVWKPFKGGAPLKAQSHYYAKIKVKTDEGVAEGIVGKVLGGAALIASLWGIGQNQAEQVYSNSPQLQTLIQYHQMATQQGDEAKIQELERRIENHKTRLSVGKGEVMGADDKPIVPSFESSIMKGIQNEQSGDDYYGWSTGPTGMRDKMKHELGHETTNYAVMINGKTWKVFADKRQADKVARSLVNKGKDAYVSLTGASVSESKIPDKCPDCGGKLVAENELTEENKDACYYKVKSRYKVWPSAYASGSLVQCRKKGASNWGNKSK